MSTENKRNDVIETFEEQDDIPKSKSYKRRIKPRVDSDSENENQTDDFTQKHKEEETYTLGSKGELILETPNNPIKKVIISNQTTLYTKKLNFRVNGQLCVTLRVPKMN